MKGKSAKGRRAYIPSEEEDDSASLYSCLISDNEYANMCFVARKKGESSHVYISNPNNEYSYRDLSKAFNDMYADSINSFKKIYLQNKE